MKVKCKTAETKNMQTSDWVLIGTTSFLGAMALLAPYIIERWKYEFYSANLSFEFFHKTPYCHKTAMGTQDFKFPVYYFRFIVANSGKTQAEQCEAVLEIIRKENSGGELREIEGFSPVSLKWSAMTEKYLTIQPGRKIFCDIGRIHNPKYKPDSVYKDITEQDKKQNKFFFELPNRPFAQWDCLIPGKYEIEIAVYSKNAKKISRRFKISWSGIWKDQESEMLNELVIK